MAHPCNAMLCQCAHGWSGVPDHDVERKGRRFRQTRDQSDIRQAGREESISSSLRICVCSIDRLSDHNVVMLFRRSLEKDISPGVDEEANVGCIGGLASAPDSIGMIDCLAELSIRRKAILQVAAYGPRVDRRAMVSPTTSGVSP
jgi:hypothetical protein